MAELFGKATGLCKGKGGSMHLVDAPRHFMGGYAIVGGHLPLATGLAFAIRYQKRDQVVLCFFGEGALPSGHAHEAFNLAALWKLPVIFICENNRYGMGTPIKRAVALYSDVAETAGSYGIEAERVDGMDVLAMHAATQRVVDRIRSAPAPYFLEAVTYRFMGHSMADPAHGHYRTKEEVEEERQKDPLLLLRRTILDRKLGTDADFKRLEQEVARIVDDSVKFADESPFLPLEALHEDIYVE
jgi:pyruvate dehydrogenase E1 component alpha subunit